MVCDNDNLLMSFLFWSYFDYFIASHYRHPVLLSCLDFSSLPFLYFFLFPHIKSSSGSLSSASLMSTLLSFFGFPPFPPPLARLLIPEASHGFVYLSVCLQVLSYCFP